MRAGNCTRGLPVGRGTAPATRGRPHGPLRAARLDPRRSATRERICFHPARRICYHVGSDCHRHPFRLQHHRRSLPWCWMQTRPRNAAGGPRGLLDVPQARQPRTEPQSSPASRLRQRLRQRLRCSRKRQTAEVPMVTCWGEQGVGETEAAPTHPKAGPGGSEEDPRGSVADRNAVRLARDSSPERKQMRGGTSRSPRATTRCPPHPPGGSSAGLGSDILTASLPQQAGRQG